MRSPGLILAALALVAALAGTAIAEEATTSAKPVTKKKVRQLVTKLAPGLAVASAQSAETAETADRATAADTAGSAGNAARLDNLDSAAFERSDAVVAGLGDPEVVSQEILTARPLGLRMLTDAQPDTDSVVVVQNVGANTLSVRYGPESGGLLQLDPNSSETVGPADTTWAAVDDMGNPVALPHRIELFAFGNGGSGVLTCFMPQGNPPDYCQLVQGEP